MSTFLENFLVLFGRIPKTYTVLALALVGLHPENAVGTESIHPPNWPLTLRDSPSCRVSFQSKDQTVCLTQNSVQFQLLHPPLPWCFTLKNESLPSHHMTQSSRLDLNSEISQTHFFTSGVRWREGCRSPSLPTRILDRARLRFSDALRDVDRTGVIRSLLIGEKPPRETSEILIFLGFVHLLNLTGIHFHFLISGAKRISTLSWIELSGGIAGWRSFFSLFTSLMLLFLWIFSGARIGALRPLAMIAATSVFKRYEIPMSKLSQLALLFCVELFLRFALREMGTFLHFGLIYYLAVGGFYLFSEILPAKNISSHVLSALSSCLFVFLFEGLRGNLLSLWTPIINLISFPLQMLLILPWGTLEALHFLLAEILQMDSVQNLFPLSLWAFEGWDRILSSWLSFQCSAAALIRFNPVILAFALILAALLNFFGSLPQSKQKWAIYLFLTWMCLGISGVIAWLGKEKFKSRYIQLDVGQGDAFFMAKDDQYWMIDTGSAKRVSIGQWIQFFSRQQVRSLAAVMLTHQDEDHRGGLSRIQSAIPIQTLIQSAADPMPQQFSGARFHADLPRERANGSMNGYLISPNPETIILNLGDAPMDLEEKFLPWISSELRKNFRAKYRILKMSHHGSATSSSLRLLSLFKPTEIWISYGLGNSYGHPALAALQRIEKGCSPPCRIRHTSLEGGIYLETLNETFRAKNIAK